MQETENRTPFTAGFWLAAFILAWTVDLLFWKQSPGISYLIWMFLAVAGLFAAAWWQHVRPAALSYFLALATLVLAGIVFLRSEPFSATITALLALAGLGLLAATLTSGYWSLYRIGDFLLAYLKLAAAGVVRAGSSIVRKPTPEAEPAVQSSWKTFRRNGFPVLRGIILALPVLAVLAALLASADPVFGQLLRNLLKFFDIDRLPEYIFRFTYIIVLAYVFTGVLLHAVFPQPPETRPSPQQPWKMRFLGSTEAAIILGSVVLLFAVFVALQVRYLFGGQANINETGFTYSEYARRGFFELVWVAVLSLGLYIGLGAVTRRETPAQERAFTLLTIGLISLVLIILVSALQRLLLYENAFGFTRLRMYTHIFIPWLAVLLLVTLVLQAVGRQGHLGVSILLVALGFGLTFAALNVDAQITRLNLQRARAGAELDAEHLASLSADAVPVLAEAYRDAAYTPAQHDLIGAALACRQAFQPEVRDWRAFRLPESRADTLLRGLDLSVYPLVKQDYATYIQLPDQQLLCLQNNWD